jgi:hypothetical protein
MAIFLHIIGALVLFAAMGLEWAGQYHLRRTSTVGQVREWLKLFTALHRVAGPAALTILVTGVYMSATQWGRQPWIGLGLVGLVTMAVLAPVLTGRRARAIAQAIPTGDGPVPRALRQRITDPVLRLSVWLRTAIGLGVVYLMAVKPTSGGAALTALGVAVVLGLAAGLPGWAEGRRPVTTTGD